MSNTCQLIMLDRDTCGMPAEPCAFCSHTYCPQCFPEHNKIHQPKPVEPKKIEIPLAMCTHCRMIHGATVLWKCPACFCTTEPLKAALKSDGTILFYVEE